LVLVGVRHLEDFVLQQERLVTLAAQRRGRAVDAEQVGCDLRSLFRREPRRRRIEDGTHGRTIVRGGAGSTAPSCRHHPLRRESLVRAKKLPLLREDRAPMLAYVPATDLTATAV